MYVLVCFMYFFNLSMKFTVQYAILVKQLLFERDMIMKRGSKNIQKILSSYFLFIMLTLVVLATIIFSLIQYLNLRSNAERDIQRTCAAVAADIDLQINQLDNVCLNTIHSTLIKETFSSYIDGSDSDSYVQRLRKNTLANALTATKGVDASIRQVNVYGFTEGGYGSGNFTGELMGKTAEYPWFGNAVSQHGHRYIPPAEQNAFFSKSTGTDDERFYLSLYRMYFDEYQNPAGFVEVMKYYDVLFQRAFHPESDYDIDVLIYDTEGNVIYPLDTNPLFPYFSHKGSNGKVLYNSVKDCEEYVYYSQMDYCGFTAVTAIKSTEFFAPVYRSLYWTLLVFIVVLFMCLLFANILSRKLSAPLKTMYRFLSNIDPQDQFKEIKMEDTGIIEIDKLHNSLNEAMRSQKTATTSMMVLKEQELQAQMLALQSQMNPHFLYNSLTTIGAMAEDGLTEPIAQMCRDITSILRYISSNKEQVSSLEEELEHCDVYLKCMKLRFGESLNYEFSIEDDMLELPIPKLCIQLLVENATKFTSHVSPPWHISIEGHMDKDCWYVDVKDNGPGFGEDVTVHLKSKMDEILESGVLPSLELDGMGILNIFIRLYLIYGITFIFDFGNLPEGGAFVKVGGRFDDKTKPL